MKTLAIRGSPNKSFQEKAAYAKVMLIVAIAHTETGIRKIVA